MSKIKDLDATVKGIDDLAPVDNLEMAHTAWLIRKETILNELEMIMQDTKSIVYRKVLADTIEFIKEGEV